MSHQEPEFLEENLPPQTKAHFQNPTTFLEQLPPDDVVNNLQWNLFCDDEGLL